MSWYAGALAAAVVLTGTFDSGSAAASSGSPPPRPGQQRSWADEVSESIGSRPGSTRNVGSTGEILKPPAPGAGNGGAGKGGDAGKSGAGQGKASDPGQGHNR